MAYKVLSCGRRTKCQPRETLASSLSNSFTLHFVFYSLYIILFRLFLIMIFYMVSELENSCESVRSLSILSYAPLFHKYTIFSSAPLFHKYIQKAPHPTSCLFQKLITKISPSLQDWQNKFFDHHRRVHASPRTGKSYGIFLHAPP